MMTKYRRYTKSRTSSEATSTYIDQTFCGAVHEEGNSLHISAQTDVGIQPARCGTHLVCPLAVHLAVDKEQDVLGEC